MDAGYVRLAFDLADMASSAAFDEVQQATWRRSVSTAYYGLFHALGHAAATALPEHPGGLRTLWRRSLEHGTMKRVCLQWRAGKEQVSPAWRDLIVEHDVPYRIREIANAFAFLHHERERADYDLASDNVYDRLRVLPMVKAASDALMALWACMDMPTLRVFLWMLALGGKTR